jgi:hypothetical protein
MKLKKTASLFTALLLSCSLGISAWAAPAQGDSQMPADYPVFQTEEDGSLCENVSDLLVTREHISYITGYYDGSFHPKAEVTRAQAAQLFYNLLISDPAVTASFSDVPEDAWYTKPVLAMASLGAIKGYPDGTFKPDKKITRAEFVSIASRFASLKTGDVTFKDVPDNWAKPAIASACAYGWISGYPDNTFKPKGNIKRAEAVKVINAMLGRSADPNIADIYYAVDFTDVSRTYWGYPYICEAATKHDYVMENGKETWPLPDRLDGSGWEQQGDDVFYRNTGSSSLVYGSQPIEDYTYYFDKESGALLTGWHTIGGLHYLLPTEKEADTAPAITKLLTDTDYKFGNRSYGDIQYLVIRDTGTSTASAKALCTDTAFDTHYYVDDAGIYQAIRDRDQAPCLEADTYYHDTCRMENSLTITWCGGEEGKENLYTLVRQLLMRYQIPLERVIRLGDVLHTADPAVYMTDFAQWQNFFKELSENTDTGYTGSYMCEITAKEIYLRTGPGKEYDAIATLKEGSRLTVIGESGGTDGDFSSKWVQTAGGWINYPYICRTGN